MNFVKLLLKASSLFCILNGLYAMDVGQTIGKVRLLKDTYIAMKDHQDKSIPQLQVALSKALEIIDVKNELKKNFKHRAQN